MAKLSKTQREVVGLMLKGWELGYSTLGTNYCWMQEGGLGRGGESKSVSFTTLHALRERGIIRNVSKSEFGNQVFALGCGKEFWSQQSLRYYTCGKDKLYEPVSKEEKPVFCPSCREKI